MADERKGKDVFESRNVDILSRLPSQDRGDDFDVILVVVASRLLRANCVRGHGHRVIKVVVSSSAMAARNVLPRDVGLTLPK